MIFEKNRKICKVKELLDENLREVNFKKSTCKVVLVSFFELKYCYITVYGTYRIMVVIFLIKKKLRV